MQTIDFSIWLFKKEPKIILPNLLSLIPAAIFWSLGLYGFSRLTTLDFSRIPNMDELIRILTPDIATYGAGIVLMLLLSAVLSALLQCVYADIISQAYRRKSIQISRALSDAKGRVMPLLFTYFLQGVIYLGFALAGLALVAVTKNFFVFLLVSAFLAVLFVLLFMLFWLTPPLVAIENLDGFRAIETSNGIIRQNFWEASFVVIISTFVTLSGASVGGGLPYVGTLAYTLLAVILGAWAMTLPAIFLCNYRYGYLAPGSYGQEAGPQAGVSEAAPATEIPKLVRKAKITKPGRKVRMGRRKRS